MQEHAKIFQEPVLLQRMDVLWFQHQELIGIVLNVRNCCASILIALQNQVVMNATWKATTYEASENTIKNKYDTLEVCTSYDGISENAVGNQSRPDNGKENPQNKNVKGVINAKNFRGFKDIAKQCRAQTCEENQSLRKRKLKQF
ncbi:unnamed protein product [Paramecium primaurelia]|uniref:Uncharacterized protein n=1 Tax=Paramecium primaurelia TaxID=5886 RepID=A0A8S1PPK0_PARPR|nr:unnamed protein product [Paramecium primaurelia]CAD8104645.1 unnamed protein product [Paramecium primaurelia]